MTKSSVMHLPNFSQYTLNLPILVHTLIHTHIRIYKCNVHSMYTSTQYTHLHAFYSVHMLTFLFFIQSFIHPVLEKLGFGLPDRRLTASNAQGRREGEESRSCVRACCASLLPGPDLS